MASALARRAASGSPAAALWSAARGFASVGSDIVSAAPGVSLQKARSWDEGVATKFSTTPLKDIFHDQVCASAHCVLAPYWGAKLGKQKLTAFQPSARSGTLYLESNRRVRIQGEAVTVMVGTLLA